MKYSKELIGQRLLYKRKQKGWTQVELTEKINEKLNREKDMLSKQISVYESGNAIPPLDILIIFCDIFDCNLDYFLCEEEQKSSIEDAALIGKDLGLDRRTVQIIKKFTENKKASEDSGRNYVDYRVILNKYLKSLSFRKIVRTLFNIIDKTNEYNGIIEDLEAECGEKQSILKLKIKGYSYEYMEACRHLMMSICPKIKD